MIIGITGQIGSGKTTATGVFKKLGAVVIDADRIGREVVESNPELIRKIVRAFGSDTVTPKGKLRRARVAEIAFQSERNKQRLDRLVHPFLLTDLKKQIKLHLKKHKVVVIDAALLLDWNFDRIVDIVLVIHAPLKSRLRRLIKRGISLKDSMARQKMQLPFNEYKRRADKIIYNNASRKEFEKKVKTYAGQFFN
jgi:dephospho-CoA kinase